MEYRKGLIVGNSCTRLLFSKIDNHSAEVHHLLCVGHACYDVSDCFIPANPSFFLISHRFIELTADLSIYHAPQFNQKHQ